MIHSTVNCRHLIENAKKKKKKKVNKPLFTSPTECEGVDRLGPTAACTALAVASERRERCVRT